MTDRVIPAGAPAGPLGDPTIEPSVRVIPLGGLGEIGLNMMLLEAGEDLLAIDCGLMFPDADMHGIDLVLPDFTYLRDNAERIDALVATHGHEDHVGGIQFLLRDGDGIGHRLSRPLPVYGAALTLGLARNRIEEAGLLGRIEMIPVAEKAGIVMGFENTLPAGQNIRIHDEINSPMFKIFYDVGNAEHVIGVNPAAEIRLYGRGRLCQVHIKDKGYLGDGRVNCKEVVQALDEIGYNGYAVFETSSPSRDVEADTKRNLDYMKSL